MAGGRASLLSLVVTISLIAALGSRIQAQQKTAAENLAAGIAHLEAGDFLLAAMTLNEVLDQSPSAEVLAQTHAYRAQAYLGLKQPERARTAAAQALKANPAIVISAPAFTPEAIALFDKLRGPRSGDPEQDAVAAVKAGRFPDAFLSYLSAYQALPDPPPAETDKRLRERIIDVVQRLDAQPIVPHAARAHVEKADSLLEAEKVLGGSGTGPAEAAAAELRKAVRIAPWWPDAAFKLAEVLQRLQRFDEALTNLNLSKLARPDVAAVNVPSRAPSVRSAEPAAVAPRPALIHVYWPPQSRAAGGRLFCNGVHVADLDERRFVELKAAPGVHTIGIGKSIGSDSLTVSAGAGRHYYVRAATGGFPARPSLREVSEAEATAEMRDKHVIANHPRETYSSGCTAAAPSRAR